MRLRLLALLLFVLPVTGYSAWEIVHNFSTPVSSIYFLDAVGHPEVGFVIGGNGWLYRTEDGGKQWSAIVMAGSFKYGLDLYFSSATTGYCTAWNGILITRDAGKSWTLFAPYTATGVIENPLTHRVFAATLKGGYSINSSGTDERQFSTGIMRNFATTDSSHMLVSCFENSDKFYFTTNGGLTWTQSWFGVEAWQPVGIPGTSTYFAVSEPFQGTNTLYRSDDGGNTWAVVKSFHASLRLTGTIRASRNALYIQSHESFYFSTDQGDTWTPFCGPQGQFDFRFYNIEDTVYAGDRSGNLWVNRKSLEGPSVAALGITPTKLELGVKGCLPHTGSITINEFTNCISLPTIFEKIELKGSGQFSLDTSQIRSGQPLQLRVFQVGVSYFPNGDRYDTASVYIRYRRMGIVFDTIIPVYAELVPTPAFQLLPPEVGMTFKYPCLLHDTLLTLRNDPCDSLIITDVIPVGDSGLTITTPLLPYNLSPDSSFTFRVGAVHTALGTMYSGVRIRGISGKETFDTLLPVNIRILEQVPLAINVPRLIDMGRTPTCATRYDTVTLSNPFCEEVTVASLTYTSPGGEFNVSSAVLPVALQQDQQLRLALEFTPQTAGLKNISLHIKLTRASTSVDTMIELRGTGVETGRLVSDGGLFFDTITTCESATRTITLENESCNTITIAELHLPIGFGTFTSSPSLPISLLGGERRSITVVFIPSVEGTLRSSGYIRSRLSSSGEFDINFPVECDVIRPLVSFLVLPGTVSDSLTICQVIDTMITVTNTALCDTLFVDSLGLSVGSSSPFVTSALPPLGSVQIPIRFTPPDTGTFDQQFVLYSHTRYSTTDTTINSTYRVFGTDRIMSVQPSHIAFGAIPICVSSDSVFTCTNSGCDTLGIVAITTDNPSFSIDGVPMPIKLAPGEARSWRITLVPDTSNGKIADSGQIAILLDDNSQIIPITLRSSYEYPFTVHLALNDIPLSGYAGDTIVLSVTRFVRNASLVSIPSALLQFSLDYDHDILHYLDAPQNITTTDAEHFAWTFDGSHPAESAELRFRAMLSQKFATTVALTEPAIVLPADGECPLSISTNGATPFTLKLLCGDSTLADFLSSGAVPTFRINPNPALHTLYLSCDQSLSACTIRFYDEIGDLQKTVSPQVQAHAIVSIDISELRSGIYAIECDYGSEKVVLRSVVER